MKRDATADELSRIANWMLNKQSVGNAIDGKDIFDALEGLKGD
jgi:hypothetical protein